VFLFVSPTIGHIQTALKSTGQSHVLWPVHRHGCACRIFYAVHIYHKFCGLPLLFCPVLPYRQWHRHVWHPVSCLFVHFNIHIPHSLYSIKLIQLRPKLNLRFFSICSFLGFQHMKYPTFLCASRLQFPCILLPSWCQVVFPEIWYDVSGRISPCAVFVDLRYEAIHILLRVIYI